MRITPLDIRKQPFPKVFRGFDPDAVNSFLEMVAGEFEGIIRQNSEFATQLKVMEQQLESYTRIERVLNETLITAQRSSDEAKVNAQKEAELIIKDAQIRADRYESDTRKRVDILSNEITSIRNQRDSFLARFRAMLSTQLNLLEVISGELRSGDDQLAQPQERPAEPERQTQYQQLKTSASIIKDDYSDDDEIVDDVPPQPVIIG
ncbi:MAG: DivIVA domain-containing protein [Chitinispirillales bacterium]|jgi:cell division initiation protein|nr:DivIVA domain-containing protein [Chitinispirillales bacterium]